MQRTRKDQNCRLKDIIRNNGFTVFKDKRTILGKTFSLLTIKKKGFFVNFNDDPLIIFGGTKRGLVPNPREELYKV